MDRLNDVEEDRIVNDYLKPNNLIYLGKPCKRGCIFCCFKQNGPKIPVPYYSKGLITKENIHRYFEYINFDKKIMFSTDDIFDYPEIEIIIEKIYDELIKKNGKGSFELVSTFGSFTDDQIRVIKKIKHKAKIFLSLISFDSAFKNKIMKGGWIPEATNNFKKLIQLGLVDSSAIWFFGNLEGLKRDFDIFEDLANNSNIKYTGLTLSYPSATKYANPQAKVWFPQIEKNWDSAVNMYADRFKSHPKIITSFMTVRDLSKVSEKGIEGVNHYSKDFNTRIQEAINSLNSDNIDISKTAFITAKACIKYAKNKFPDLNWIEAEHNYWGGDIVACDLLTLDDINDAINLNTEYSTYVISKGMFIEQGNFHDLHGKNFKKFIENKKYKILMF